MSECPCCFEELTSSFAALSCSHRFHITCLVNWFATQSAQELPQNCPCCRTAAGEKERLPEESEGEDEESDGSEFSGEEEAIWLTRFELDDLLKNTLGGTGVPDALWFAFFNDEGDEEIRADAAHRLPFTHHEIATYAIPQGGRQFTDEEWEILVERYPEPEDPQEPEEDDRETVVELTRHQLEDAVWAAGGVGVSPEQWAEGSHESETALFTRAELDAYLAREDQSGRPITDEQWAALVEAHPASNIPIQSAAPLPALRITWRRCPDGHWERIVLNPEQEESASWGVDSAEPPPADLVEQTSAVALRFQALWRGFQARKQAAALKKEQEARDAAAKIQAIWRGHQQREQFTAVLALRALRLSH